MKPFMQLEGKARDYLVTILLRINYNFEISPEMTQDCYFDLTHILYVDLNYQDEEIVGYNSSARITITTF